MQSALIVVAVAMAVTTALTASPINPPPPEPPEVSTTMIPSYCHRFLKVVVDLETFHTYSHIRSKDCIVGVPLYNFND